MEILTYKAFCLLELTDDPEKFPEFLYESRRKALEAHRSYHGHPCDDPLKRGALCEVELKVKVGKMPKVTDDLIEYVEAFRGKPALLEIGNERWNRHARESAKARQRQELKRLHRR